MIKVMNHYVQNVSMSNEQLKYMLRELEEMLSFTQEVKCTCVLNFDEYLINSGFSGIYYSMIQECESLGEIRTTLRNMESIVTTALSVG